MGTFFHPLTLIGPAGTQEPVRALVDTGALFTVVPTPILQRLGVRSFTTMRAKSANGAEEEWPVGQVEAALQDRRMPILCLFGPAGVPPLLGAHALEAFLLTVDSVEQRLVPKLAYLM
jgi:predicted aspartyl protease